jgi:chorismate dehydratase
MRIGAVNYLNSKPLVWGLRRDAPDAELVFDLPSRLADSLAAGRLDVALIPTVELFRAPTYKIVSDACVACDGPVLSVKLHFRVPPAEVKSVALDEGSRTSAALSEILLAELYGIHPVRESLPIGCGLESSRADAVLLIGDRAMLPTSETFHEIWDLGQVWRSWTGLPFVFAMWIARAGSDSEALAAVLSEARDKGERNLESIAITAAKELSIPRELALQYLQKNLHFHFGVEERAGLSRFHELCVAHRLVPRGELRNYLEPNETHGIHTRR